MTAGREGKGVRCEGRRRGTFRGGKLRMTCGCGRSGEVPVRALVARLGEEICVSEAVDAMRCRACGARTIRKVRWLEAGDDERYTK